MTSKDFDYRIQIKDKFVATVLLAKKQVLVDKNQLIEGN